MVEIRKNNTRATSGPPTLPSPPSAPQSRFASDPPSPSVAGSQSTFGKRMNWGPTSREAKKRKDMKMRVITQAPQSGWQRPVRQNVFRSRQGQQWKERLPESATELLARLYEALIMAKNCEVGAIYVFLNNVLQCVDEYPLSGSRVRLLEQVRSDQARREPSNAILDSGYRAHAVNCWRRVQHTSEYKRRLG
jgi:hypothetical protein